MFLPILIYIYIPGTCFARVLPRIADIHTCMPFVSCLMAFTERYENRLQAIKRGGEVRTSVIYTEWHV